MTQLGRRKRDDDDVGVGSGSSKKPKTADSPLESDLLSEPDENEIVSDVALMEKLERVRCTIPPEVDSFKTLLPVSVFFLCKGQQLTLASS